MKKSARAAAHAEAFARRVKAAEDLAGELATRGRPIMRPGEFVLNIADRLEAARAAIAAGRMEEARAIMDTLLPIAKRSEDVRLALAQPEVLAGNLKGAAALLDQ